MPWYFLPSSTQKGLISELHYVQNGPAYTIGSSAELKCTFFPVQSCLSIFYDALQVVKIYFHQ